MSIDVSSNLELKSKILSGVNKLADTVTSTLGPGGRNVLIQDQYGSIRVTKDGVSVSKSFTSVKDPIENTAIQLVKTVAEKAVDKVGDGTTTATLLAQSIINEGFKAIDANSNPIQVKVGIDKAVAAVLKGLKEISQDINTEEQITQVARLSANGDAEIANLITQALDYVGDDGAVSIEESRTNETTLEKVEGMIFDRGYKTPYFCTNQEKMEVNLSNPYILICADRILNNDQVTGVLNFILKKERPLLVIAEDIDSEALSTLIVNSQRSIVKVCAVKAPEFGERRTAMLEDIATMTGGTVVSEAKGVFLKKIKEIDFEKYLGECRTSTITAKDTTLVDGKPKMVKGDEDGFEEDGITVKYKQINPVETRLLQIKSQLENAKSNFEIENLQARVSKLTGGVAIINVGGVSEVEMKEKKDRVDDALHATKAAILEGVVPGGGMALIACEIALDNVIPDNSDQRVGIEIIRKTLYAPFKKILANAGIENHYEVLSQIKYVSVYQLIDEEPVDKIWIGYDVKTGNYGSLKLAGVVDPTKVTRTALENAASVAGIILTTTAAVFEVPEEKSKQDPMDPQMYQ